MALRLYANDTTGYNSDASSLALQPLVNKNLSTLSIWFEQNLLSIYNIKIQTMILGSSTSKYELFIKGMGIEVKPILKILRVTTEEQISTSCELACGCYCLTCCTPLMLTSTGLSGKIFF